MHQSNVYFAENLRVLRKRKGLSQIKLAKELGITRSRISSYEEGRGEPSYSALKEIISYFGWGVTIEEVVFFQPEAFKAILEANIFLLENNPTTGDRMQFFGIDGKELKES